MLQVMQSDGFYVGGGHVLMCLCMQQGEQGRGALSEQRVVLPSDSNAQYGRPTVIRAHRSSWPDC